jgi:putative transposase
MDISEYKHQLAQSLSTTPHLSKVDPKNHWLYVPESLRVAILQAREGLDTKTIAEITSYNSEAIERWFTEEEFVAKLKEKVDHYDVHRGANQPYSQAIRPDVCKLAKMTAAYTVSSALGLPRSTIKRWLEKGWGEIDAPVDQDDTYYQSRLSKDPTSEKNAFEINVDDDPQAQQLELFLERHKGKSRKKYSLAEKKLMMKMVERFGSKAVHDKFKVSYDTIARLKRQSETALERKTHTPLRYIPVVELMKKHPGMGPTQIRDYLRRHLGLSMGVNSVRKVMEQHGWVPPFVRSTRVNTDIRFYEAARRNYMWHMDFKHQYINNSKAYILFIQDDQSRFIVGHTVTDSENVEDVLIAVEEAIRIHGKPESIMSDGGSAFFSWRGSSKFTRFLEDFGIDQLISQTPNINGKVENLNQQLEKEVLLTTTFSSLRHFDTELAKWVGFYNFSRVHQGLSNVQVPADRYFPGAGKFYGEIKERVSQQSLIAETMGTLLAELKKSS